MGMTIDDNVNFLNEAKDFFEDVANDPEIKETIKTYCIIESLETAIDTMRKYQKIEQTIDDWEHDVYPTSDDALDDVERILEDGNDR